MRWTVRSETPALAARSAWLHPVWRRYSWTQSRVQRSSIVVCSVIRLTMRSDASARHDTRATRHDRPSLGGLVTPERPPHLRGHGVAELFDAGLGDAELARG